VNILLFGPLLQHGPMIRTDFDRSSPFLPTALPANRTLLKTLTPIHPHPILLSPIPLLSFKGQLFSPGDTHSNRVPDHSQIGRRETLLASSLPLLLANGSPTPNTLALVPLPGLRLNGSLHRPPFLRPPLLGSSPLTRASAPTAHSRSPGSPPPGPRSPHCPGPPPLAHCRQTALFPRFSSSALPVPLHARDLLLSP